jgi:hypothetical protein
MHIRLVKCSLIGAALAFAPLAHAAPTPGIHSIQDLFDACADPAATSQIACDTYIHASIQTAELVHAADHGGNLTALFCPNDQLGPRDLLAELQKQVSAHPERKTFPAPTVIIGGAMEAYPCPKPASAPAPAHKPAKRSRRG